MHNNAPRCDLPAPETQTAVVFDSFERDEHRFECIVGADREHGHDLDDCDVFPEDGPYF